MKYPLNKLKTFVYRALALILGSCLWACDSDDNKKIQYTIPPGHYVRTEYTCGSTESPPTYPNHNRKAALGGFDDLTEWRISFVKGGQAAETFTTPTCTLTLLRSIFTNENGFFSFSLAKVHQFAPADCQLSTTVEGENLPIDPSSGIFSDVTDGFEDLRFSVGLAEGGGYLLESLNQEPINQAWRVFGCGESDTIRFTLLAPVSN